MTEIWDIVEEQGWSLANLNKLLLRFIEEQGAEEDLVEFLGAVAQEPEGFDDFDEASLHGF